MEQALDPHEKQKLSEFQKLGWPSYLIFGIVLIVLSFFVPFHQYVRYFFGGIGGVFLLIALFKILAKRKAALKKEKEEVEDLKKEAQQSEDPSKYQAPEVKVLRKPGDDAVHQQIIQQSHQRQYAPRQEQYSQPQQQPVHHTQHQQHPQHHHPASSHHRRAPPRNVIMSRHPGQRVIGRCMHCHAALHQGNKFCPNCGWKIG